MERRIDLNRLLEAAKSLETAAEYITAGAQQLMRSARILKSLCTDALSDLSTSDDSHQPPPPASGTTETADASIELEAPEKVPQEDDPPRSSASSEAATVDDMATAPIVEGDRKRNMLTELESEEQEGEATKRRCGDPPNI